MTYIREAFSDNTALYILCDCGYDVHVETFSDSDVNSWTTCQCGRKYAIKIDLVCIEPEKLAEAI